MHAHTHNAQCRCPKSIGSSLGHGVVANWVPMVEANTGPTEGNTEHQLKQCTCGCNVYSGTSLIAPTDADSLDIPALPIQLDYVDDDDASDDHEYVSIKITELSDMMSAIRSCTCQDH